MHGLSADDRSKIEETLAFWFGQPSDPDWGRKRARWFERADPFDEEVRRRLGALHDAAMAGRFDHWADDAEGVLALLILLDQVPRNIFRGTPRAYESDAKALATARAAVAAGHDRALGSVQRWFIYLPFEHSEDLDDQRRAVELFQTISDHEDSAEAVEYAIRHLDIIARFGRFPHRNAILGRVSTAEEEAFLKEPNSSF